MKRTYILLAIIAITILTTVQIVAAETGEQIIGGLQNTGSASGFNVTSGGAPAVTFEKAFLAYATGFAVVIAALFAVIIIYAGFLWMTARGNEEQVGRAKKMILGSVIGLTIVVAARLIAELTIYALNQGLLRQ